MTTHLCFNQDFEQDMQAALRYIQSIVSLTYPSLDFDTLTLVIGDSREEDSCLLFHAGKTEESLERAFEMARRAIRGPQEEQ